MKLKAGYWVFLLSGMFCAGFSQNVFAADSKLTERLELSSQAFKNLMASSDSSVPESLLKKAEAIVIFPRTINVAWGIGGQYGNGVAFKQDKNSGRWSAPAFYTIGGLTFGPQIGGQAIDIVLVIVNEKGLESLLKSKSTLGADAGIAVGPAGRNATATTDLRLQSEIYSYSRAKGLYIGLSLKGAVVAPDSASNEIYYGRKITAKEIFQNLKGPHSSADAPLVRQLERYSRFSLPYIAGIVLVAVLLAGCAAFFLKKRGS